MKVTILFLTTFCFLLLSTPSAFALGEAGGSRTYKVFKYEDDKNHDFYSTYKFGIFEPIEVYQDPEYVDALSYDSPLLDPRFASYDVVAIINLKSESPSETNLGQKLEVAQRMRIYIRPQAIERIGWERFHMDNNYDPNIGLLYHWKVSSAKVGATPVGHFNIKHFSSNNKSVNYNNAPMPWAVFFKDGLYATHGTTATALLGSPQSHGCVRLETQRAREFFHLVGAAGAGEVDVVERYGKLITLPDGSPKKSIGYKTLLLIK